VRGREKGLKKKTGGTGSVISYLNKAHTHQCVRKVITELPTLTRIEKHCPMTFACSRRTPYILFFWLADIQFGFESIDDIS
jgi:hypothetical protein